MTLPDMDLPTTRPVCIIKSRRFPKSSADAIDGGSVNALRIAEFLCAHGIPVEVFTRREEGMPRTYRNGLLTIHHVGYVSSSAAYSMERDYEEGRSFVSAVLNHPAFWPHRYQCIHTHHWTSGISLPENIPESVTVIHTPHLLATEKGARTGLGCPPVVQVSEDALLCRANHIIALSRDEANSVLKRNPKHNIPVSIVPNGVDERFFGINPFSAASSNCLKIVTVGRLCIQKGLDILLDAVELLLANGIELELTLVGGPYHEDQFEARLRARINRPPLYRRVNLLTRLHHTHIPEILQMADLYVQPSRYESQCIALLEAMATGRVVVASRLGAIEEYVNDCVNGFLVPPEEPKLLAHTISKLLSLDNSALRHIALRARSTALEFNWLHTLEKTETILLRSYNARQMPRLPTGEHHNQERQWQLVSRAESLADTFIKLPDVQAVLLTGSVARGPVEDSSDLDIHVVVNRKVDAVLLPSWRFGTDGVIENVHQIEFDVIVNALSHLNDVEALADFHYHTKFGDELTGFRILSSTLLGDFCTGLSVLQASRARVAVAARVASHYARESICMVRAAQKALHEGALFDSVQILRLATQSLLIAALIQCGWTIRGSKKRLEIASNYLAQETVEEAMGLVFQAVGLDALNLGDARRLCRQRLDLREQYQNELRCLLKFYADERRSRLVRHLDFVQRHNAVATDYYQSLLDNGMFRGPVNHIRCLSGFPYIPTEIAMSIGGSIEQPISWFLDDASPISSDFKMRWLDIAGYECTASFCQTIQTRICNLAIRLDRSA